jgi:WhiB family redox-sensing transcriptional regulator
LLHNARRDESPLVTYRGDWRERAACRGVPPDLFFPPKPRTTANYKAAKKICEKCPVQEQCLNLVLPLETVDDRFGLFGGMTPSERRRLRFKMRLGSADYGVRDGTAGTQGRVSGKS